MTAPICNQDSTHGAMVQEHVHLLTGEIDSRYGLFWFCPVKGCHGYGGPVTSGARKPAPVKSAQMELIPQTEEE